MKTYTVTGRAVTIHAGAILRLTEEQAHGRRGFVASLGDDLYRAERSFQLKHGEEFGFDGEFPKALASVVVPASAPVATTQEPAERPSSAKPRGGRAVK